MIMDKLGNITLYNADCMEIMKSMPDKSVDFILTDIPYLLDLTGGGGCFKDRGIVGGENKGHSSLNFVSEGIDYEKVFPEFERLCKIVNMCIFCSNKQVGKIMTYWEERGYGVTLLVWDKPNPIPLGNGKYISNLEFIVYVRAKGATFNNLGYEMQLKTFRYAPLSRKTAYTKRRNPKNCFVICCVCTPMRMMWCLTLMRAVSPLPLPVTTLTENSSVARYCMTTTNKL